MSGREDDLYIYRAIVVSVYDGDTIRVDWDLGASIWMRNEPIRLYGINAPEVRGEERPEGLVARDWLREKLIGKSVIMRTIKDAKGKYGRYLGIIYLDGENINEALIEAGMAQAAVY